MVLTFTLYVAALGYILTMMESKPNLSRRLESRDFAFVT